MNFERKKSEGRREGKEKNLKRKKESFFNENEVKKKEEWESFLCELKSSVLKCFLSRNWFEEVDGVLGSFSGAKEACSKSKLVFWKRLRRAKAALCVIFAHQATRIDPHRIKDRSLKIRSNKDWSLITKDWSLKIRSCEDQSLKNQGSIPRLQVLKNCWKLLSNRP